MLKTIYFCTFEEKETGINELTFKEVEQQKMMQNEQEVEKRGC